jgi:hypothetical protein
MIELEGEIENAEDLRKFLIDVEARLDNVEKSLVTADVEARIRRLQERLEKLIRKIEAQQDRGET